MTALLFAVALADPYLLEIGPPGRVTVQHGFTRTPDGTKASAADVAAAAKDVRFVFVGESHDSAAHHQAQADVVQALVDAGREVSVGFEMFTRENQPNLTWPAGEWDEATWLTQIRWKDQWGMDYALYKPIFEVARKHKLPLVALNVPRTIVRKVSREGYDALTEEEKAWVPTLDTTNKEHRAVFDSLIGGHPESAAMDGMYRGMVAWDMAMAQAALEWYGMSAGPKKVMVVIAGSGHVMYDRGINLRITQRTGERTVTVTSIDSEGPREVSKGIADFVFSAPPPPGRGG
jgi:uncharacterized iron-regulated protein